MTDRLLTPEVVKLAQDLCRTFAGTRAEVLAINEQRRTQLRAGKLDRLEETAEVRRTDWEVDPVPVELLERRVELIGGGERRQIIEGMNAGAKSCIVDLWNMTVNEPAVIMAAHRNIERASDNRLAYVGEDGGRVRINPHSSTRLMVVPRPLHVDGDGMTMGGIPVPPAFLDLAILAHSIAGKLRVRQGGLYLYLREVGGYLEARLWKDLFEFIEERMSFQRGTIRATVMMDSLSSVLEADEILYELSHHSAGLTLDPQSFAADHLALFSAPDRPVFPDREHIGLNATFLRSLSLTIIGVCHRRQAHAIGAPSFVLPPDGHGILKPVYLDMIADKEREAVDGHDGTLVTHPGLVNPAMTEFNKSMPRAHQMYYQRPVLPKLEDLVKAPEGSLTTVGITGSIRTVLRAMVAFRKGEGTMVQGDRIHDRSSVRLSSLLLWQWTRCERCFITDTGLEVHADVMKYLVRKECDKLFKGASAEDRECAKLAVKRLVDALISAEVPTDLLHA